MSKLEIAKKVIEENFSDGDCGLYCCRNIMGDSMDCLYDEDDLTILICYGYGYFEVFGLDTDDFEELCDFYRKLQKGDK